MRIRPWLLAALLIAGSRSPAEPADPQPIDLSTLGSPTFTTFTPRDGVPDVTLAGIATDARGFVWLSSALGLSRYDGHRWELVPVPETSGRTANLTLDHAGTLWVACEKGGVARLDASGWHAEGRHTGLTTDRVIRVVEIAGPSGDLETWALSVDGGLFMRVAGRWRADPANADLPTGHILGIARTSEIGGRRRLWVATFNDGLWFREEGATWQRFRAPGLTAAQVDDLLATRLGGTEELWIATYGYGLFRLTGDGLAAVQPEGVGPEAKIVYGIRQSATTGGSRVVWAATRGGVLRVRGERAEVFDQRHGLPSNAVRSVSIWRSPDGIDVLWAATEAGVARAVLGGSPWRTASLLGSKANGVFGVLVEPDGRGGERLWVASSGDGLGLFEDGRWRTFSQADGTLPGSLVRLLVRAPDDEGRSVLYTAVVPGELLRVREGPRFELVPTPWPKDTGQHVLDLLSRTAAGQPELWVATRQSGIYRRRGGVWTAFRAPDIRGQWRVVKLVEQLDPAGRSWLWASTNQGLARFDGVGWVLLGREAGIPDVDLIGATLLPDQDDRRVLWLGSSTSGIIRVDVTDPLHPSVLPRQTLPSPPAPTAYSALRDSRGRVYVCTDAGVQLLTRDASGNFRERLFRRRDGLVHDECNTNAQFLDSHDRYWAGTLGGLSVYDPERAPSDRTPKPLELVHVRADGLELPAGPVRVPSTARELRFEAALLSWQRENESRFRWQLAGYDPGPGPWVPEPVRVYGALPPGRYLLRVEAQDYAGRAARPIELAVEVVPAWWQTSWFRLTAVGAALLAAALLLAHRMRRFARQKAELARLVETRTAELAAANERLAALSREDALTHVANRRWLDEALDDEWRRATRLRTSLACLLLDIDFFKAYNDALGHQAGDECLAAVARAVAAAHTRAGELVARYGGEEFAVLIPGASRASVLASADNVRRCVEDLGLHHPSSAVADVVTVSVGVAWKRPRIGASHAQLVAAADRALYRAKDEGRNRVREEAEPEDAEPATSPA